MVVVEDFDEPAMLGKIARKLLEPSPSRSRSRSTTST
jgi:hypothetical protein